MKQHFDRLRFLAEQSLDLLYPPRCPLCEAVLGPSGKLRQECSWKDLVCPDCAEKLPWIREPACKKCGRPLEDDTQEYCEECTGRVLPYREGRCTFRYSGDMRNSVLRMKFHNRREYLDFFAASMAEAQKHFVIRTAPDVIVPVPMNPRKRRERGFDQCRLLAERLSGRIGVPVCPDLLTRVRHTRPQKGLGISERRENVRSAFTVKSREKLPGRVMLVDDIFTTGSTIEECSRALGLAGVKEVYYIILCTAAPVSFRGI